MVRVVDLDALNNAAEPTMVRFGVLRLFTWWIVKPHDPCVWCGLKLRKKATKEHITPRADGGTAHWSNVAIACSKCNTIRGSIPMLLWMWSMHQTNGDQMRARKLAIKALKCQNGKK